MSVPVLARENAMHEPGTAYPRRDVRHADANRTAGRCAEAWIGVVTQILDQTQLSYALHYQTAELRDGAASRDALWGAVQLTHAF